MSLPVINLRNYNLNARAPEAIDSSMLKDFVDCPSMFYLRHVLGLRRKRQRPGAGSTLDWGTCWHGLQEVYWKTKSQEEAIKWLAANFPDSVRPDTDKQGRSRERMFKMFFEYIATIAPKIEDEYETLRTEQFFDIFNEQLGIRWAGRMDKIRLRRKTGQLVVWDYKTSSAMGQFYFESHEHGFQLPGYVWAAGQMGTGQVKDVVLDVLYTLKTKHEFFQKPFRYETPKLIEWTSNVKRILDQIHYLLAHHLENPDAWVKNWNECTRYSMCQFSDVHFTLPSGDTRLRILEEDYVEDRWDPLAHDAEAA